MHKAAPVLQKLGMEAKGWSAGLSEAVSSELQRVIYVRGDYVIREGRTTEGLFFIKVTLPTPPHTPLYISRHPSSICHATSTLLTGHSCHPCSTSDALHCTLRLPAPRPCASGGRTQVAPRAPRLWRKDPVRTWH